MNSLNLLGDVVVIAAIPAGDFGPTSPKTKNERAVPPRGLTDYPLPENGSKKRNLQLNLRIIQSYLALIQWFLLQRELLL